MPDSSSDAVVIVGSYPPRKCGIATFSYNLARSISEHVYGAPLDGTGPVRIFAMTDRSGEYAYGPEVKAQIDQYRREDYRSAAEIVNSSRVRAVSLQHEYGLFAGESGSYVLEFLDRLQKPLVTTFHTIISEPAPPQRDVLQRIAARSSAIVVMAERAKTLLREVYGVATERVHLVHHGVPDFSFEDTEPFKEQLGLRGLPTILTFGLLSPNKSIQTMLRAIAKIVCDHPDVAYLVLGVTHPNVRRESGEAYRIYLERLVVELGIEKNVIFHNRYVTDEEVKEYLLAADVYATPYGTREQITSGTLAYALASGRAIISTPYWHAQELLAGGRGRLAEFDDPDDFADGLRMLLEHPEKRERMRLAAYEFGRQMTWPNVARRYAETFDRARESFVAAARTALPPQPTRLRLSLPEVNVGHMFTLTDDTGILQHAVYMTPDRRHGYCTDDNARALIVAANLWHLFQDERALPRLSVYLSFLHHAYAPETGRFRNYMSYDRRWLEDVGSDDCQGRALWALGYLISHSPNESIAHLAGDIFRGAISRVNGLESPRSWAQGILGLQCYLQAAADDPSARQKLGDMAYRLNSRFVEHESADWPWFEDVVTYDNGRLPQALIIAGLQLSREELVDRGLRVLQWLLDVQTAGHGHLSIIGNDGWYKKSGERARYDQQPLEAAALIGACKAAHAATGDRRWLREMRRCFDWFLGRNDKGLSMVDFHSRGCYDGLMATGVNESQGAESVLSWLLSNLTMHEMQSGDTLDIS